MPFQPRIRDIVWICVDGLRADCFRSEGNRDAGGTYFEALFNEGQYFPRCYAAAQSTIPSAFSFFTGIAPTTLGLFTQTANCLAEPPADALTLTDVLKLHRYTTLRWDDMCTYSCHPKSGFDYYEGGYFNLSDTPRKSFDAHRRDSFLALYRQTPGPRFLYMHLDHLHEYGGESAATWSKQKYTRQIAEVGMEVRGILGKLGLAPDTLLLVNSDHGITLDEDWKAFEREKGGEFHEARMRVFSFFRCQDLGTARHERIVGNIDLAATLLDMVGIADLKTQGVSLLPAMLGRPMEPRVVSFMWAPHPKHRHVIGGECPRVFNSAGLRTDGRKYYQNGSQPAELIALEAEPLQDGSPAGPIRPDEPQRFEQLYRDMILDAPATPNDFYAAAGQTLRRSHIPPRVTCLLPATAARPDLRATLLSLLDQVPYHDILVCDADASGHTARILEEFGHRHDLARLDARGLTPAAMLNLGLNAARGDYCVLTPPGLRYTENFLYELLKAVRHGPAVTLAHCDLFQVYRNSRNDYHYLGPDHFWIMHNQADGGAGAARRLVSQHPGGLGEHNHIGHCALFPRRTLSGLGGFPEGDDPVWNAWRRLAGAGTVAHVERAMVLSMQPAARPEIAWEKPPRPQVSVLLPVERLGRDVLIFLHELRNQGVEDLETLVLAPREQAEALTIAARDVLGEQVRVLPCTPDSLEAAQLAAAEARGETLVWCRPGQRWAARSLAALYGMLRQAPEAPFSAACMGFGSGVRPGVKCPTQLRSRDIWALPRGLEGILYRADAAASIGPFRPLPKPDRDWDFLLRLAECGPGLVAPEAYVQLDKNLRGARAPLPHVLRDAADRFEGKGIALAPLYSDVFAAHAAPEAILLALRHFSAVLGPNAMIQGLGLPLTTPGSPPKPTWDQPRPAAPVDVPPAADAQCA